MGMDPEIFRCKVLNTLHLFTWCSINPTSKKYFLHVQSIQYFAPKYLGVHISNFEKILFARAKYSILCTYIPGGPYIQLGKILIARAKYSILCTCKKYCFKVGYMDPQIFKCKVLNTLHVQEVFVISWIYGPPDI